METLQKAKSEACVHECILITPGTKLEEIERLVIIETLRHKKNNRTHSARALGIGIRTLQRKIKQYNLTSLDPIAAGA